MRNILDKLDILLLDCLQKDNLQTADELAERVGRSPSAVARRLRQLRAVGAVVGDVSLVSEEAAGSPLFAVVHVQLDRYEAQAVDLFRRQLVASENIQMCLEVTGAFDFMLLVVAADMSTFNRLTEDLLAEQRAVRRFETSFVKKRAKATLAIPLEVLSAGR